MFVNCLIREAYKKCEILRVAGEMHKNASW